MFMCVGVGRAATVQHQMALVTNRDETTVLWNWCSAARCVPPSSCLAVSGDLFVHAQGGLSRDLGDFQALVVHCCPLFAHVLLSGRLGRPPLCARTGRPATGPWRPSDPVLECSPSVS
jgi:hypothetical protein